MAGITIVKVGKHQYVRITESYRDENGRVRSRVIENLGNLQKLQEKDPLFLEHLKEQLAQERDMKQEARLAGFSEKTQTIIAAYEQQINKHKGAVSVELGYPTYNVASALLRRVWSLLELPTTFRQLQAKTKMEYSYDKAAFLLCHERILNPGSKYQAFKNKDQSIYPFMELNDINAVYRVLDRLKEDKEAIVKRLNKALGKLIDRDMTLAFYDVTTYSFESRMADELRDFGMSKDHRSGEVQVVLGLVCDQKGIPVDYELFPGNTNEFGTMIPIIKRLMETYHIKRCIVVADRGLNSNENLLALLDLKCDFVIAQKIKNCANEQKAQILAEDGWSTIADNSSGEVLIQYKTLQVIKDVRASKISKKTGRKYQTSDVIGKLDVRWVVSYSPKRAKKDNADIDRAVDKALEAINGNRALAPSHGYKSFIVVPKGDGKATLNINKIEEARAWAGYYAICTNCKDLSEAEVTRIYRQLWRIEDCFRVSKSALETRPCFVWTPTRIAGHFLTCYISLVMQRFMIHELKAKLSENMTSDMLISIMKKALVTEFNDEPAQSIFLRLYRDDAFDKISEVFGLKPVSKLEGRLALGRKLGLKQLNQIVATQR